MKKSLLIALIGATALVPAAALAQDRGERGNRGPRAEQVQQRQQAREARQSQRQANP